MVQDEFMIPDTKKSFKENIKILEKYLNPLIFALFRNVLWQNF